MLSPFCLYLGFKPLPRVYPEQGTKDTEKELMGEADDLLLMAVLGLCTGVSKPGSLQARGVMFPGTHSLHPVSGEFWSSLLEDGPTRPVPRSPPLPVWALFLLSSQENGLFFEARLC